jgi:hypothetical protein
MSRESQTDSDRTGASRASHTKAAQGTETPFHDPDMLDCVGICPKDRPVGGPAPRSILTGGHEE